jgi:NtrC-family two-component system sensor histidine kinase KinB
VTLRNKLLLSQAPLAATLILVAFVSYRAVESMGAISQSILKDNYRSVLAAQRMKDAVAQLDRDAVRLALGSPGRPAAESDADARRFESELQVQEGNITEVGEAEATLALRKAWDGYRKALGQFEVAHGPSAYSEGLTPWLDRVRQAADEVLALNLDAMVRKNDQVRRQVDRDRLLLIVFVMAASVVGLGVSATLMARVLRPLGVLRQAVRRVGEGDLAARISLPGSDELSAIAEDFNVMTDRLRAYRQSSLGDLIQAQEAAQSAIDSLSDPVLVFDAKGSVINVNRAAAASFTLQEDHLDLGRLEVGLREAVERARSHALAGKGPYVPKGFEEAVAAHTPEGDRFFLVRATPVYAAEGGVAGTTVVLQDVTRLRLFDELKNDLVATVAHEFRSPLTSLRMAIHLCLEGVPGPLTAKQQEVLYTAREDCERLQDIVEDLLDVARIQAGRLELARRRVPVSDLLHQVASAYRREAEAHRLTLYLEPAPANLAVQGDPERIELVFSNLLNNALHFTPAGGRVEVRVHLLEGGAMVRFEVSDTGPGVPEEYRARIFEKFFQVPGAPKGTAGLGLYIASEIVTGHGGEIGVEGTAGQGSTFWFTLPSATPA